VAIGTRAARERNERELREHERALKTLKESLAGLSTPFQKQLRRRTAKLDEPVRKGFNKPLTPRRPNAPRR
jgi:hypothetical protein